MIFRYVGDYELAPAIAILPVFHSERQPPESDLDSLPVQLLDHVLHGGAGKHRLARLPITIIIESAIVQGGPVNSELLELGNGIEHRFRRNSKFGTPTTPAHGVVLVIIGRSREPFLFDDVGP